MNGKKIRILKKRFQNNQPKYEYVKKSENNLDLIKQRIKKKSGEGGKPKNDVYSKMNNFLTISLELQKNKSITIDQSQKIPKENLKIKTTCENSKNNKNSENENNKNSENEKINENSSISEINFIPEDTKSLPKENEKEIFKLEKRDIEVQTEEIFLKKHKLKVNSFQKRNLVQNLIKLRKIVNDIKNSMSKEELEKLEIVKIKNQKSVG